MQQKQGRPHKNRRTPQGAIVGFVQGDERRASGNDVTASMTYASRNDVGLRPNDVAQAPMRERRNDFVSELVSVGGPRCPKAEARNGRRRFSPCWVRNAPRTTEKRELYTKIEKDRPGAVFFFMRLSKSFTRFSPDSTSPRERSRLRQPRASQPRERRPSQRPERTRRRS